MFRVLSSIGTKLINSISLVSAGSREKCLIGFYARFDLESKTPIVLKIISNDFKAVSSCVKDIAELCDDC